MSPSENKSSIRGLSVEEHDVKTKILEYVTYTLAEMQSCRKDIEETWVETYAQYIASSKAQSELRAKQIDTVGNVGTEWRHHIDRGKAFEVVETIHAYLLGALFPNDNWFDASPRRPSDINGVRVLRKFIRDELKDIEFEIIMDEFVRQFIITGNSCLFFPWDEDTDSVDLQLVNMFDCWVRGSGRDPMKTDFVRRVYMSRAELRDEIAKGCYDLCDELVVDQIAGVRAIKEYERVQQFQGLRPNKDNNDICEVYEYWGKICVDGEEYKNVVVTFADGVLLRVEENKYECGIPMVFCSYIPVLDTVYGIGALQSSLGLIHVLNILENQRLDGVELTVNPMWTKKSSSSLDSVDVYAEPGKVLEVDEHDDVRPMPPAQFNIGISYQEANYVESAIDKNSGTGPLVGAGASRNGERVTAAEIAAIREAGGNRLSGVHRRLEKRGLTRALDKIIKIYKQYKSTKSIVRYAGAKAGQYDYAEVTPADMQVLRIEAKGSEHIIENRKKLQDIYDFLAAVNQDPEMAKLIDKAAVLRRLMRNLPFDDPEEFLVREKEPAVDPITQIGGQSGANAINQQMQVDGGNQLVNMLKDSYGRPSTSIEPTSPVVADAGFNASVGTGIDLPQQ
jgi:hypothetical protein